MDLTLTNHRRALRSIRPRPRGQSLSQETTLLPGLPVALTGALQRSSLVQPRFLRGERDSPASCLSSPSLCRLSTPCISLVFFLYFSSLLLASQKRSSLPICERRKGAISLGTRFVLYSQLDCDYCCAFTFSCWNWLVVGVRLSPSIPFSFKFLLVRPWFPYCHSPLSVLFSCLSFCSLLFISIAYRLHRFYLPCLPAEEGAFSFLVGLPLLFDVRLSLSILIFWLEFTWSWRMNGAE